MKRVDLMIIPALICGGMFLFASCNKENGADSALNFKAAVLLEEIAVKSGIAEEWQPTVYVDTFVMSGDNIRWYNASTGEIKFRALPGMPSIMRVENEGDPYYLRGGILNFIVFLEKEELFALDAICTESPFVLNHPVLIGGGNQYGNAYYIAKGYPNRDKDIAADWANEREANWKAIEPGWNKFIAQLKKEGKYRK